jgi:molybdopterin converting factor small subunit
MITVRLPSTMSAGARATLDVHEPVTTVAELIDVIDRRVPGFRDQLNDSVFNFAVNDEMLLFRARDRVLRDGDVVEVIPTISGGSGESPPGRSRLEHDSDDHGNEQNRDERFGVAGEIEFNHGCPSFREVRRSTPGQGLAVLRPFQ